MSTPALTVSPETRLEKVDGAALAGEGEREGLAELLVATIERVRGLLSGWSERRWCRGGPARQT